MPKRRNVLIGLGGMVTLAGCGETSEEPESETQQSDDETEEDQPEPEAGSGYQVRISYDGEWTGSISGNGSSRSVQGSGTETFDVDGDSFIVSANAQKQDSGSGELTVEILENGEVIASNRTTAEFGVAQVTSEDGVSSGGDSSSDTEQSDSTFEVRIQYSGEWQGSISSGGSSHSIQGSGTEAFEIDGDPDIISANAQKQEANSEELTIQILEGGEVVEETSTSAEYGVAQVTYSSF